MRRYPMALAFMLVLLVGCTEAPRQTVELSNTVGRDLIEIQRAHRELAQRYFDRVKGDINNFVDTKYRPFIIQFTLNDPQLRFMERFQAAIRPGAVPDAATFMGTYSSLVIQRVEAYRREALAPVLAQERNFLSDLDDTYLRINTANSAITGYLGSVVKVSDAQNELLASLKMPDLREKIVDGTVRFSDQIAGVVQAGQAIDTSTATAAAAFGDIVTQIKAVSESFEKR